MMLPIKLQESESRMDLDTVSDKHLHELERLARELLSVMHKAKLEDETLGEALNLLEDQTGKIRCRRFDLATSEYTGY